MRSARARAEGRAVRYALVAAIAALAGCPVAPSQPAVRDHRQPPASEPPAGPPPAGAAPGAPVAEPPPARDADGRPAGAAPDAPVSEPPARRAAGEPCTDGAQCASGVCEGPCGGGTCAPAQRTCTRDLRAYCGCDGRTFRASGACPGRLVAHRGECQAAGGGKSDGEPCRSAADCASGVCEGQGCDDRALGRCVPKDRICTADLRDYCGCDGETFSASGTCPGRRYLARGACR